MVSTPEMASHRRVSAVVRNRPAFATLVDGLALNGDQALFPRGSRVISSRHEHGEGEYIDLDMVAGCHVHKRGLWDSHVHIEHCQRNDQWHRDRQQWNSS